MGIEKVPGHKWEEEWCTGTYQHRNVARAHMGTRKVPGHIRSPEGCMETHGKQKFS